MKSRFSWILSGSLLFVLLGVSLATVAVTSQFWWQQQLNGPPGGTATAGVLKEKLEMYNKRADELEKLLTLLLGVSTIYAIALGFSAYQQLKDSTDKTEKLSNNAREEIQRQLRDAKEEIQEFVVKVETRFPLFADMDVAIRKIMDRLTHLLPLIDWSDEDYRNLNDQEKQEILFYEKTVASFEYFDLRRNRHVRETTSEIYHGLGNFYGLKYEADRRRQNEDKARQNEDEARHNKDKERQNEDKERSKFYLDRSIIYDTKNTGALNDRGFYALRIEHKPDLKLARERFNESRAADPDHQRAIYNLAWIEQKEGNFSRSEELLSQALGMTKWQKRLSARNFGSILYNRACSRAQLGAGATDPTKRDEWLHKSLDDLIATFPVGKAPYNAETVSYFKQDIQAGGDLCFLASNDPWSAQIRLIVQRLPQ